MIALVTGGAGFVGSHVVDRLRDRGVAARIYDTVAPSWRPNLQYHRGSILDLTTLISAMQDVDVVLHLAAAADVNDIFLRPGDAEMVNTRGTFNVLEAARRSRIRKVIFASTVWVYGDSGDDVVDENTSLQPPRHLYTATKIAAEGYCHAYHNLWGLTSTILRYGVPYGPRARMGAVIPNFVECALNNKPMTIAGDGSQWRRFVYVEDLAEASVLATQDVADNRIYNLDGKERISIRQVAETIRSVVGDVEIRYTEARPGDFFGKEVLSVRAKQELGWEPRVGFEEGVRRYVDWYRSTLFKQKVSDVATASTPKTGL